MKKLRNGLKALAINTAVCTTILIANMTQVVFAGDASSYITNISTWIETGVKSIVTAMVGFFAIKLLAKRQFISLITYAVLAGTVMFIVWNPTKMKDLISAIYNVMIGSGS